ncbi:TraR/DksA C4-type zinc finger protein [Paenibacillus harenae]|uniref:YteA family regulatory protein n=1 Tax=Paenibacillus harenae TaxID=306543 RepID=A0ABT9TZU4_PAEHA|nr:TraR/DksA C4-type zinc finger protein [Paenibacillus harenae]MDQ0059423.1 YteA family regulatory protein [Paenibacillus harenae]MDQ0112891.1 YteA family regulatory protein [Paenibacillus harenae]
MTTLTSAQLALLRMRLEDERREIENRLSRNDHYGLASSLRYGTGELTPIDNHPGDTATELYEREKDIALHEQEELHLERIDAALAAMDNGTYGICKASGQPIPFERLEAAPDTLYSIEYAPRQIVSDRRPAEEPFLYPPFGRTSMDDHEDGYNGFDGEDAWQIVEQYGNTDSPAMSENRDVTDYDHVGIEAEENDGYVESIESFLATDITGRHLSVVRNREYNRYMETGEGDHSLENPESDELQ